MSMDFCKLFGVFMWFGAFVWVFSIFGVFRIVAKYLQNILQGFLFCKAVLDLAQDKSRLASQNLCAVVEVGDKHLLCYALGLCLP